MINQDRHLISKIEIAPVIDEQQYGGEESSCDSHHPGVCPDCGIQMVRLGSCFTCPLCGFGGCA